MSKILKIAGKSRRGLPCQYAGVRAGLALSRPALALAAILFSVLFRPASAEPLSQADVKNLLARIHDLDATSPNLRMDFQEQRIVHLMNEPIAYSGKIWFQAPNKFRREVRGNSPSVNISDGQQLWIYYPNFKSAERYLLGRHSPADAAIAGINTALNLEGAEATFQISGNKIDNHYELQLLPRSPSMKRMFQRFVLRIDQDLFVERTEILQPNGDRVVTTYSNQSRAPISQSTFEFTPPPGIEVTTPLGR
jgi:outer membrane lipoprotein carrier protein